MSFNLIEEYKVINLLASTAVLADVNGTGLDLEQYHNDAMVIVNTGAIQSTLASYVINIQGSTALNGTYTTLASLNSFTQFSYMVGAVKVNIEGLDKKYVRAQVDATANNGTINAIIGVNILVKPRVVTADLNSATLA